MRPPQSCASEPFLDFAIIVMARLFVLALLLALVAPAPFLAEFLGRLATQRQATRLCWAAKARTNAAPMLLAPPVINTTRRARPAYVVSVMRSVAPSSGQTGKCGGCRGRTGQSRQARGGHPVRHALAR